MEKLSYRNKFSAPMFFVFAAVVLVISVIIGVQISTSASILERETEQRLLAASRLLATRVTAQELAQLRGPDDMQKPLFAELRQRLVRFAEESNVLYAYFEREDEDGWVQYIVDNDLTEGTVNLASESVHMEQGVLEALSGMAYVPELGSYSPGYDGLLSAFAPVFDENGAVVAVAGVDISDAALLAVRNRTNIMVTLLIAATVVAMASGYFNFLLHRRRQQVLSGQLRQQELMSRLSANFLSNQDVSELIPNALRMTGEFLGVTRMLISVSQPDSVRSHAAYVWCATDKINTAPTVEGLNELIHGSFPPTQQPGQAVPTIYCNNTHADAKYAIMQRVKVKAFVWAPLYVQGKFWAMLSIEECFKPREWTQSEQQLISLVGSVIAAAETRGLTERHLRLQDRMLHAVNDAAGILLASDVQSFERDLCASMNLMAECVDVDRIFVWENFTDSDGQLCHRHVYGWQSGASVRPLPAQAEDRAYAYRDRMPDLADQLAAGKSISGLVNRMPPQMRAWMREEGVQSELLVPVLVRGQFWGFISFEDRHREREFSKEEQAILCSGSLLIVSAMQRNETTQSLVEAREAAFSSARAKSDFLTNMSHEIRTPINAVTGMAAIARGTRDLDKIYGCLDKIDAASRQLLGLINDILDMSKIEAQKLDLAADAFMLSATIQNIRSIIGIRAAEKQQVLTVDVAGDVPPVSVGDEMRISQVLINLLSNAVKFTPEYGRITLSLKLLSSREGRDELEASVSDTGIGIAPDQMERLFTAFEQADRSTARRFGGTGLGLAISKRIVELMDGDITVQSAPGEGSTFTARFWLNRGTTDMLAGAMPTPDAVGHDFSGCVALLAEDVEVNREIVMELLRDTHLTIDCAGNGQEVLDMFCAAPERYDIIYMDIHMPVMDGYTATEKLRAMDFPRAKGVPIVAMTANAFSEDVARCLQVGMNDHVAKPIDWKVLVAKTAKHLL
ncbi:MAG: response regulator [Oscillospiraceae bacterium]|jgi:signal transduction histidine kinase/CheY-like chemotaxis protein|nr:response regulator [Oscillospiraceae bacterium]